MSQQAKNGDKKGRSTIELPEKTYFKIGEVAKFLEVEPYVLRYWETEFKILDPEKTKSGQRVYKHDDIELLFQIRTLLYEEMFTIAGACRQLERQKNGESNFFDLTEGAAAVQAAPKEGADDNRAKESAEAREQRQAWIADARRKVEALESTVETLRARAEAMGERSASLRQVLDDLRGKLDERPAAASTREVEEMRQQVASLKAQRDKLEEESSRKEKQLRRRLKQREKQRRELLNELRHEVQTIESVVNSSVRSS